AFTGDGEVYGDFARLGILVGSLASALIGYFWLSKVLPEATESKADYKGGEVA
ncbi:MAG: NhaA family Na+:H+ antiporter, partial [Shewanella sp.]